MFTKKIKTKLKKFRAKKTKALPKKDPQGPQINTIKPEFFHQAQQDDRQDSLDEIHGNTSSQRDSIREITQNIQLDTQPFSIDINGSMSILELSIEEWEAN